MDVRIYTKRKEGDWLRFRVWNLKVVFITQPPYSPLLLRIEGKVYKYMKMGVVEGAGLIRLPFFEYERLKRNLNIGI